MPPVRGDRVGSRVPRSCCLPPSAPHQCRGGLSPLALADPGAGRAHVSSQYLRGDEANTQPKLPG